MRITSGVLRNRRFNVPNQEVRPTKESVREAIFSSLGGSCDGLNVLDLFSGSGALGMEAWSRGADSVTLVEQHAAVWKNLKGNIDALRCEQLGSIKCIKSDAIAFLSRVGECFDLILADPPYDLPNAMERTLAGIAEHSVLTDDGILVYELRSKGASPEVSGDWKLLRDKKYGQTRILVLKLNKEEQP
jgi:16S rRNA (guanine966-N2)-methyltransferase